MFQISDVHKDVGGENANKGNHKEANYMGKLWRIADTHFTLYFYNAWSRFINTS